MHAGLVGEDGSRYHLVMSGKICTKLRSVYEGDGVRGSVFAAPCLNRSSPQKKKIIAIAAKRHSARFWAESRTTELGTFRGLAMQLKLSFES